MQEIIEIVAYQCSDGKKYLEKGLAERRQALLNSGHKPCVTCDGSGKVFINPNNRSFGGYEAKCDDCNGFGYLVLKYVKICK